MSKKYINFNVDGSISKYLKEIKKSNIIDLEREIILAEKIKNGDQGAIDELVGANLKFVISIAKGYQGQGLTLNDLINEGNYGLIKAASRFDHTKGFRFISYAVWWIKQSIIQSLNDNSRVIRLPVNIIIKISQLKKEIEKFEAENDREPVFGEILDENNEFIELLNFNRCASLNDPINEEGDELIELIYDHSQDELENRYVDNRLGDQLNKTLETLDPREREIIECYFGINRDSEPMTLEAIGEKFGLTKERIRQIKGSTLRKLRHNSEKLFEIINE